MRVRRFLTYSGDGGAVWGWPVGRPGLTAIWPLRCGPLVAITPLGEDRTLARGLSKKEQRKWARLQLAIPVFVRARDGNGKDSLEFATAINIGAGGALVAVRRSLPESAVVSLEIPSAPLGSTHGLKTSARIMQAKAVWVAHTDEHHLLGLKFTRPLNTDAEAIPGKHLRKVRSPV
jgi:hypothetical protein